MMKLPEEVKRLIIDDMPLTQLRVSVVVEVEIDGKLMPLAKYDITKYSKITTDAASFAVQLSLEPFDSGVRIGSAT